MNKSISKPMTSNKLPVLIGWLILMGFIIFPSISLIVVFDLSDFNYLENFHLPILPKLDQFSESNTQSITVENTRLWFALLIPYLLILIWFSIYVLLVYSNNNIIYTGQYFLKNIGLYSLFLLILVFISFAYALADIDLTRFGRLGIDYSKTMSIEQYSSKQMGIYLFVGGCVAALEFLILLSVFMYRKRP